MALVKCPECGKDVSDKANTCPNCGYPLHKDNPNVEGLETQAKISHKKSIFKILLVLTIVCSVCWVGMYLWQQCNASEITHARAVGFASSISGSFYSKSERSLVKLDNFIDVVKKIDMVFIIVFGSLSIYYYNVVKRMKNCIDTRNM